MGHSMTKSRNLSVNDAKTSLHKTLSQTTPKNRRTPTSRRQNPRKIPPKNRAALRAVLAPEIQHHHFPEIELYTSPSRNPTPSDKRKCKTLKETYVVRRPRNETDNPPTNPSAGETARVGRRVVSPYKKPPNPGNQAVIVITGYLGQGYKTPRSPSRLFPRPVPPTTPSRRRARRNGPRKGAARAGGLQAGRP